MNEDPNFSPRSYSPFLPIAIVLIVFIITNLFQTYWLIDQKSLLNESHGRVVKAFQNYQVLEKQVEGIAMGVWDLSKTNRKAAQVVSELNLKLNNNQNGAQPTATP